MVLTHNGVALLSGCTKYDPNNPTVVLQVLAAERFKSKGRKGGKGRKGRHYHRLIVSDGDRYMHAIARNSDMKHQVLEAFHLVAAEQYVVKNVDGHFLLMVFGGRTLDLHPTCVIGNPKSFLSPK